MTFQRWLPMAALPASLLAGLLTCGLSWAQTAAAPAVSPAVTSVTAVPVPAAAAPGALTGPAAAPARGAAAPLAPSMTPAPARPATGAPAATAPAMAETPAAAPKRAGAAAGAAAAEAADAARQAPKPETTKESAPPAAEVLPNAGADQTEFQRFVAQNTGKALPLYGYNLFAEPDKYAPVLAAPVPATYVLGPGDELLLQTYGVMEVAERLVIDRNGRISLPKVGQVQLAGIPFGEAEKVLQARLSKVYANFTMSLTMGRLRSIEVFVLGQAARPGKHVVSGLSTLINALFETGGASSNGSLRAIELRRAGKTLTTVDLYQFIARGDNSTDLRLQSGDVIYIPPAGDRAAVLGTMNAPAIYELRKGETIASILALSGGLPVLAAPQKAQLERVDPRQDIARYVEDFALDEPGLQRELKAGDVLTVFQVSPQIANVVTLEGNVAAPMRYTFRPGMRVSDILSDPRLLIPVSYWLGVNRGANSGSPNRPEVNLDYATIQRLDPQTLRTRLFAFSPSKAMAGSERENLRLKSGDIVTIYAPNQAGPQTEDSIAIRGEVVGGLKRFPWREGMRFKDLIPSTQWLVEYYQFWERANGINLDYATVERLDERFMRTRVHAMSPTKAWEGDAQQNIELKRGDVLTIYPAAEPGTNAEDSISVAGEVVGGLKRFPWRPGFKVKDIIPSAQWLVDYYSYWQRRSGQELRNDINWDYAQVIRRIPETLQTRTFNFSLGGAVLQGREQDNLMLQPGDQIALFTTRELPVPLAKRIRLVSINGEVKVPGVYQVAPGETLPQLLQRAGGFTPDAYVYGTEFRREATRQSQQQNLDKLIQRLETQMLSDTQTRLQNITSAEQAQTTQAALQADRLRLANLRQLKASGRVALRLDPERTELPTLPLEDGDTVTVPHRPGFVGVYGAVNNDNALLWRPGMTVGEAIREAGTSLYAEPGESFVLRADGTVLGSDRTWGAFGFGGIRGVKLLPGDTVVVPEKADRESAYTAFIRGAKDLTAIFYQFGLGAAAIKTLKDM